jgi:cohesin loading factor subunit SCC2
MAKVRSLRASVLEAEIMGGEAKLDAAQEVSSVPVQTNDQEARVCTDAIDSVFSSAKMVATYLVQRSSTNKANKTSLDTDYKAVLDTLVGDLLTVLYRPEWPAASLFLSVISRLMVRLKLYNGADG